MSPLHLHCPTRPPPSVIHETCLRCSTDELNVHTIAHLSQVLCSGRVWGECVTRHMTTQIRHRRWPFRHSHSLPYLTLIPLQLKRASQKPWNNNYCAYARLRLRGRETHTQIHFQQSSHAPAPALHRVERRPMELGRVCDHLELLWVLLPIDMV